MPTVSKLYYVAKRIKVKRTTGNRNYTRQESKENPHPVHLHEKHGG